MSSDIKTIRNLIADNSIRDENVWLDLQRDDQSTKNIYETDSAGRNVLFIACIYGRVELVNKLLDLNFDFNHTDQDGKNALFYVLEYLGNTDVVEKVLNKKINLEQKTNRGNDLLTYLLICRRAREIEYLLKNTKIKINKKILLEKIQMPGLISAGIDSYLYKNPAIIEKLMALGEIENNDFDLKKIRTENGELSNKISAYLERKEIKKAITAEIKNSTDVKKIKI